MMRLVIFTKARSHKYLRKVGSGSKAQYIYKEPQRRVDVKAILADPNLRKKLMVPTIVATQAREGVVTTTEQAERAYDKVSGEKMRVLRVSIARSLETAAKQQEAHEKKWGHKVRMLSIGTKVGHWIATDVAGERFWIHDTKGYGIVDDKLLLEVGHAAIDNALRHKMGLGTRIANRPKSSAP